MGGCFSSESNVEIIDEIPEGKQYDFLRPGGTSAYRINQMYDIPEIEINFDGWHKSSIRLWLISDTFRSKFLKFHRTPLPSPTYSSSSSDDSGFHTVF